MRKPHRESFSSELQAIFHPDEHSYNKTMAKKNLEDLIAKRSKTYPNSKDIPDRYQSLFTYLEYDYEVRIVIYSIG
ncbi:MAG: hypothetical protein JXQ87_03305 [Bacteroidia bacterium]